MVNYILLGSIAIFFLTFIFISFKNNNKVKRRKSSRNTLATFTDYTSIPTKENLNLVDNSRATTRGIISSQEKKQNKKQKIVQNKPIGWVHAKSYQEDIINTNISRYIPNSNYSESINNNEKTKKDKKQEVTILVVDDSVTILKLISTLLSNKNYNLIFKQDGISAYDFLKSAEIIPSIIITDLEMIEMHGEELIEKTRELDLFKNTPILLLSTNPLDNINLLENQMINGIVKKPFIKEDFLQQISYLLN